MVKLVVSEAEFLEQQARLKVGRSALDDAMIGAAKCRLEIPLADPVLMRWVADQLRGFAARLDHLSRQAELTDRQILLLVQTDARDLTKRMHKRATGQDLGADRREGNKSLPAPKLLEHKSR